MKSKNGYTVIELIIVIAVVGIFGFVAINKASYAFSINEFANEEMIEQKNNVIESQAVKYGEDNKDIFEESNTTYIRVADLIENNYLSEKLDVNNDQKIKLILKDDKVEAYLES